MTSMSSVNAGIFWCGYSSSRLVGQRLSELRMGNKLRMFLRFFVCMSLLAPALAQDLQHPASFPQVAIKGTARPDAGYMVEGFIVDGQAFSPDQVDLAGAAALRSSGWKTASLEKRRKLALDWCTQVALVGNMVLWEAPADFPGQGKSTFRPPVASKQQDGKIHVRLYWFRPGGNVRVVAPRYFQAHWTVGPDGQIKKL